MRARSRFFQRAERKKFQTGAAFLLSSSSRRARHARPKRSWKLVLSSCHWAPYFTTVLIFATASSVDRTLAGDFGDLPAKLLRAIAINGNDAFETIDPAAAATFQFGALLAILRMDFGVRDINADAPEGQLLVTGIEAQRHRGAGAKRNSKEVVERWSEIETAFEPCLRPFPSRANVRSDPRLAACRRQDCVSAIPKSSVRQRPRPQGR